MLISKLFILDELYYYSTYLFYVRGEDKLFIFIKGGGKTGFNKLLCPLFCKF